jgi:hypothetical protein
MTDATEFLKNKIQQMDTDDKHFANAIKREPIAQMNQQPAPQTTPPQSRVQVRKSTPNDETEKAANALAWINGPITIPHQEG